MHQANRPSHGKQQGIGVHKTGQTRRDRMHVRNSLYKATTQTLRETNNYEKQMIQGSMPSSRHHDSAHSYAQSRLIPRLKVVCHTSVDKADNAGSSFAPAHQGGADTCIRKTAARTGEMQPECTAPWTGSPVLGLDQGAHFVQDEAPE